jgi:hypothetical protein
MMMTTTIITIISSHHIRTNVYNCLFFYDSNKSLGTRQ